MSKSAVILAGGKGTRLRPFTTNIPKPLMPIGDIPILEVVLRQLKFYGFENITITVNHLAELLMAFFGNGEKLGLNIKYSREELPLGTAAPLSLIENLDENFLVMNGDVLTTLNYGQLFDYHIMNKSDFTISTYKKHIKIDLGVIEMDGDKFSNYKEKPEYDFDVSMGIYVVNRNMLSEIPNNEYMDMPDFILKLNDKNKNVNCYTGDYHWLDIGRIEDYELANEIFQNEKSRYLPDE